MNLKAWIEKEEDTEELLPICHTTRWKNFEKIIEDDRLSINCSKFPYPGPSGLLDDKIVYFFYGLPFYIYETGDGDEINTQVTEDLPIALIFKPEFATQLARFYPFDTGALLSGKYKKILSVKESADLKVYEVIISDGNEMKKLVKRYYEINEKYCFGDLKNSVTPCTPKEENLLRLLQFNSNSKFDMRVRAVEMHSLNDITISDNLIAVLLPRLRTNNYPQLKEKICNKHPDIKILYYNEFVRFNSQSVRDAVINETMRFYNDTYPGMFSYDRLIPK